jgi:hypothetical protein
MRIARNDLISLPINSAGKDKIIVAVGAYLVFFWNP